MKFIEKVSITGKDRHFYSRPNYYISLTGSGDKTVMSGPKRVNEKE